MRAVAAAEELLGRVPSPSILVAFSGGKDSIATLDLCMKRFGRVEAFFMFLVEGLRCEESMLRHALRRYPGLVLHRVPHWELSAYMKANVFECNPRHLPVKKFVQADVERFLRDKTGIDWFAWGEKAKDSIVRNAKLKNIGGFSAKFHRVYPIYTWKDPDIYGYLRSKKLPIPRLIGGRKFSGAVSLYPPVLLNIREQYPDDYEKICRKFPGAEAAVFRYERGLAPDRRGRFYHGASRQEESA